jgi:hypothetical protein
MFTRIGPSCIVLCLVCAGLAHGQIKEQKAFEFVKELSPSVLDSSIEEGRFSDWLEEAFPHDATIEWELNDCGEQTGNPAIDTLREMPVCVGITAKLGDGREIGMALFVGTDKEGLVGPPAVYYIYVKSQEQIRTIQRLSDLKSAVNQMLR